MTADDRQLLAEIEAARATERELFNGVRAQKAKAKHLVADCKLQLANAERNLTDLAGMEDASLDRLAKYDRARREVASR